MPHPTTPSSARRRSARIVAASRSDQNEVDNAKNARVHDERDGTQEDASTDRFVVAAEYGREGRRAHVWVAGRGRATAAGQETEISRVRESKGFVSFLSGIWVAGRATFLPDGYPNSVSDDYMAFQFWDTAQGMCSYVRGSLTTRALLEVGTCAALDRYEAKRKSRRQQRLSQHWLLS